MKGRRPPTLLLFDLDDVLCRYDRRAFVLRLADRTRTEPEHVRAVLQDRELEALSDSGELEPEAWLDTLGQRLGRALRREDWVDARSRAMTPHPEVLTIVSMLRTRHDVAVFTNHPRWLAEDLHRLCPSVAEAVDGRVVTSAMLRRAKPHPDSYVRCAKALGHAPEQAFLVDDLSANVAGARHAGMRAHRFRDAANLRRALRRHELMPRSTALEAEDW